MAKRIRTLFLSHDSSLYGAQRSLLGLLEGIDRNVVESYVVAPDKGDFGQSTENLGIPFFARPLTRWVVSTNGMEQSRLHSYRRAFIGLRSRVAALCELIEKYSIDVVYTNTVTCIDGALAARVTKRRHVWHLREHVSHNRDLIALLPAWLLTRFVSGLSDHIIVNSKALRTAYDGTDNSDRMSVVYNGINLAAFFADLTCRTPLLHELGLSAETKIVTIMGSITPRKGHLLFVEAAAEVKRLYDKVAFLVVGEGRGPFLDAVISSVQRARLIDYFRFVGYRSDAANILRASDVLVVAADQEAFGRTIIEAMATSVPVVATRCGGPEEIVLHGETGLLVPNKDATAIANAISSIITNPELAMRLGTAGRTRAEKGFSLHAYAGAVQSILTRVAMSVDNSEMVN